MLVCSNICEWVFIGFFFLGGGDFFNRIKLHFSPCISSKKRHFCALHKKYHEIIELKTDIKELDFFPTNSK